jgi:NADH:ubiquinone oxidoreductase subunit 4 (subunit M)
VHVEATTEISIILASVVLKVGFFGMYKFLIVNVFLSSIFLGFIDFIILFGLFNVAFVLSFNVDYKKVIAF